MISVMPVSLYPFFHGNVAKEALFDLYKLSKSV
jgi:hypothetical protein